MLGGIFTAAVPQEAARAWAAARGLTYSEEGLLPPLAGPLRLGLGVGSRLAGLITSQSDCGYTSQGGFTRRPERGSWNLCEGALPGGIRGVLAHHHHLETRSGTDGQTWVADVDTVVVHRLPERGRGVRFGEFDGDQWRCAPPEDAQTMAALAAATPHGVHAEIRDGVLCVWLPGIVEEPADLDGLCHTAARIAAATAAAAARHAELDPRAPVPRVATSEVQWLERGAARIAWRRPPASVAEARAAYEAVVQEEGAETGRKVRHVSRVAFLVIALIGAAVSFAFGYFVYGPLLGGFFAVCGLLWGVVKALWTSREAGAEATADQIEATAWPWALEAFAAGYAQSRGYVQEDADAVRRRFPSPLAGHPQRALHRDDHHLLLWKDTSADASWLLHVSAAPAGPAPPVPAPYRADKVGSLLVVGVQAERTAAALDDLVATAARAT